MPTRGFDPGIIYPRPIHYRRWARNGGLVEAACFSRSAYAQNHILGYRKKWIASFAQDCGATADGPAGAGTTVWRAYTHTGHGTEYIACKFILAFAQDNGAVDPIVEFSTVNPSTGATIDSQVIHYNSVQQTRSPVPRPSDYRVFNARVAVSEDTTYGLTIDAGDFGHPVSACIYEVGYKRLPFTSTGTVNPEYAVDDPVLDTNIDGMLSGQDEILRSNRPHLLSYGAYNSSHTITNTAYANVLDTSLSTAGNVAEPGFRIQNRYHNTTSNTEVPVVFAAYVDRTASGDCYVKLDSGSDSVIITVDSDTAKWYTATGTIPANSASTKYDVHAAVAPSGTMDIYAWTLFEYE